MIRCGAVRSRPREDPLPWAQPPAELFFFYLVAPVLFAPVLERSFFTFDAWTQLGIVAENYLPFFCIPGILHAVYKWAVPRVPPLRRLPARMAFHAAIGAAVAILTSLAVRPLMALAHEGHGPPAVGFAASCVVITWTLLIPALMVQELRTSRLGAEQAALRAQLEALKSRTLPHFLFNALNTIASLIPEQPALAEALLERMAGILRYALRSARQETVTLQEEIAMAEDYLEVQRARFGDRLKYHVEIDPDARGVLLPPLVLQPLVENAVLHGIAPRIEGGTVQLFARAHGGLLAVRVEDEGVDGHPSAAKHRGTGTSLDDLRTRLELLYGERCSLELSPNARGGFTASLSLPWSGA